MTELISPQDFSTLVRRLRGFFFDQGFLEVHTQNRLSILAACEDPTTIATFDYAGQVWPLPQTGQMWLEYELLKDPSLKGVFCLSTSFRQEPQPVPGRHDLIFPMFEFESKGGFEDLIKLEKELCHYLGLSTAEQISVKKYLEVATAYGAEELTHAHEQRLCQEYGPVVCLTEFPVYTSPFWNMKLFPDGKTAKKCDVIIGGMETIGSAERETDRDRMRHQFQTISEGQYANLLFAQFGRERVIKELDEFLSFDFFKRYGGGMGFTRLLRYMKKVGKL